MTLLKNKNRPTIQGQIDDALTEMGKHVPGSEEHNEVLKTLERLKALEPPRKAFQVSGDAVVGAVVTFVTTAFVLHVEKTDVVTSKMFSWIPKPKL